MIMVWINWYTSLLEKKKKKKKKKKTLDLILTSLPGQFHDSDQFSDHDVVSGTLKVIITPYEETPEKGVSTSEI